jgi:hypothetical protein
MTYQCEVLVEGDMVAITMTKQQAAVLCCLLGKQLSASEHKPRFLLPGAWDALREANLDSYKRHVPFKVKVSGEWVDTKLFYMPEEVLP